MRITNIIWILALLSSLSISAQEVTDSDVMYLRLKTGEVLSFKLTDKPDILFSSDGLNIGDKNFLITDVDMYTFSTSFLTEVAIVESSDSDISYSNGELICRGFKEMNEIHLTDINGLQIPINPTFMGDSTIISVTELSAGTYILYFGNRCIKFIIR